MTEAQRALVHRNYAIPEDIGSYENGTSTFAKLYTLVSNATLANLVQPSTSDGVPVLGKASFSNPKEAYSDGSSIVIHFPAMPNNVTMGRTASYEDNSNLVMPDGFPIYKGTSPLTVNVSFNLSADNVDYLGDTGGGGLVALAAKLHALTLPIKTGKTDRVGLETRLKVIDDNQQKAQDKEGSTVDNNTGQVVSERERITLAATSVAFPPVCVLDLLGTQAGASLDSIGVVMVGYVRDVNVSFKGPWKFGPAGSGIRIPTSAEYSFTFVNAPAYRNNIISSDGANYETTTADATNVLEAQAYAQSVRERFYNTVKGAAKRGGIDKIAAMPKFGDLLDDI